MPNLRWSLLSLVLVLAIGGSAPLLGQDAGSTGDAPAAIREEGAEMLLAPVAIDGDTLFSVRGIIAYPAERRARDIANRIRAAAADRDIRADSLTLDDQPGKTWILAGEQRIMAVLDEDAVIETMERRRLAELYRARIGEVIQEYRRLRQPRLLWFHLLYALGATIALVIAAYLGRVVVAWLREHLERRYRARVQGIQDRAFQLVKAEQIWHALTSILNFAWAVCLLVIVYFYLNYVLALFPWTRALGRSLLEIAVDPLRTMGLGLLGMVPKLVFLAILILVTRYLLRLIRLFFDGVANGTVTVGDFDPEWAWPTYRLVRMLVVVLAAVVAYPYVPGSGSEAFKGISLFVGIIFSLGSSSLIGNLIAGYSMTYRRAFRIGDLVRIGDHLGAVERTRMLVTHLRTPKNEEVVVPNSTILGAEVVNFSSMAKERGLILHTTVGIGYETPWRQVEAMLLEAARRTAGLRQEPAPFVLQKSLGDFCVTYEINVYCDTPRAMPALYSELHRNILDVFNEYGVQIMTPAYEGDPDEPKVVPREQWYSAPARPPEGPDGAATR